MKKVLILLLIGSVAYRTADVLSDLGISRPEAQQKVFDGITSSSLSVPAACRKLVVTQRATVLSGTVQFAKAYLQTDDFKKRYATWREEAKPTSTSMSYDQVQADQKRQIADMKKSLVETKANIAKMDASTQKAMQEVVKQQEKMIAEMEAGTSPILMKRETIDQVNKVAESEYQEKLQKWEEEYPADAHTVLRKRLNTFLDVSGKVDFAAKLTDRNGKKHFVNPDYESQSTEWKQCFRAGSDATATARQLAQTWLSELDKK